MCDWRCRYEGEAEDLGLTFSVEDDNFGRRQVHELCQGGDDMAVTSSNKLLYVHLMADWHLNRRLGKPAASFAAGLNQVGYLQRTPIQSSALPCKLSYNSQNICFYAMHWLPLASEMWCAN